MSVSVIDNTPKILAEVKLNGSIAIKRALDDVKRLSRPITPLKQGQLRDNVLSSVAGLKGIIKWGMVYAQYQERGARRDGSHRVRKYTTGGTGKGFAKSTVSQVDRSRVKYLRGLIR